MTTLAPSGMDLSRHDGTLTLNGVDTRTPAWWLLSLAPAYRYGDRRGMDKVIPYVAGSRAYRRRRVGTDYAFRMVFGGRFDSGGGGAPDPAKQLWANFYLFTSLVVADPGGDGTIASVFTDAAGGVHNVPVQVLDLTPGEAETHDADGAMRATLVVHVPRGGWLL